MKPLVETYKTAVAEAEPVGDYVNDNVAITTSFMCLEDGDAARDWMTRSRNGRQQSLVFKYLDTFPKPPGVPDWPEEIPDPTLEQLRAGVEKGSAIVGTPDECAEILTKWQDIGVDQLIMGPTGSTYPHELVEEAVELFGTKVIPRFDDSPDEARAARFRREAAQRSASGAG
jgi:alkanesulfonate monooxygenase SsuD/methylene tetrahydromethanopterin reductase-like flavin-dependent oxidoreductase (luciferase family)